MDHKTKTRSVLIALCALLLALPTALLAQVPTADIVGTATDPNGAAVAEGTATATNLTTGITQSVALSKTGDFTFTLLQIGAHSVTVKAPGFKEYQTQVTLAVGDRARVSAQLVIGQANETVTVQSMTPALQTDDSTIGTLITSQATQDLPSTDGT